MNTLRQSLKALHLALLLSICLHGCGGSGGGRPTGSGTREGAYSGTWTRPFANYEGTVQIEVASDGTVSGTVQHNVRGSGTVTGTILSNCGSEVLFHNTIQGLPFVSQMIGELDFDGVVLSGTLKEDVGDFLVPVELNMTRE